MGWERYDAGIRYLWPKAAWGARQGRGVSTAESEVATAIVTDPVSRGEEEDRSDQWGPSISDTRGKRKRERRGRWAAVDYWNMGERSVGDIAGKQAEQESGHAKNQAERELGQQAERG